MNGCMLPGRTISWAGAVRLGSTTETDGTAACTVAARRAAAASTRDRIPKIKSPATIARMITGITQRLSFPPTVPGLCGYRSCLPVSCFRSVCAMLVTNNSYQRLRFYRLCCFAASHFLPPAMQHAEQSWNEKQRGNRREHQAADHSTPQGSVLLAAISQSQGHWNHANNHG